MAIIDLYSKRQKRLRGEMPEVYVYDEIPSSLRIQVVHVLKDAFGSSYYDVSSAKYKMMHDALAREYGLFHLSSKADEFRPDYSEALFDFLLNIADAEQALDVIELSLRYRTKLGDNWRFAQQTDASISADQAIKEINVRFEEHGVGYQFESGEVIRADSRLIHSNVVKPTLALLQDSSFSGANDEFLKAHEHYRHGRLKEAVVECLKSLESTLKTICDIRGWSYKPSDTAQKLLAVCFDNGLIPAYLQSHYSALRSTLESGVPTLRNKTSGHGQGAAPTTISQALASYTLHLTATSILFLVQAEKELPQSPTYSNG